MRVGFDEQAFLAQSRGGISRYVVSLVEAFRARPSLGVDPVLGWKMSNNEHAVDAGLSRRSPRPLSGMAAATVCYVANSAARRAAKRVDILHHTYYHPAFRARRFPGARVSTVYDMTPELHPDLFPIRNPHLAKAAYVAASDLVLCISEATRRDLVAVYGTDPAKTAVVALGVDARFSPDAGPLRGLPGRYVLYIGARSKYKDFDVLLDAFAALKDRSVNLLIVGDALTEDECNALDRAGVFDRTMCIRAADSELPMIYANALLLAFPSRCEGFGLPTLEAMASGIPVVLADASAHPEVGGSVARYFPPGDAESLRTTIEELIDDSDLRAELGRLGVERTASFTWSETARQTAAAYTRLRDSGGVDRTSSMTDPPDGQRMSPVEPAIQRRSKDAEQQAEA